jgi:DNA-binding HxlR family transcriptional regulator
MRVEYQLSVIGKSLSSVFKEMTKWGEEHGTGGGQTVQL